MSRTISRHLLKTIRHLGLTFTQMLHQLSSRTRTRLLNLFSSRQQGLHRMQRLRVKGNRTSSTNLPPTRVTHKRIRHMTRLISNLISLISHNLQRRLMIISRVKRHFSQCTNHLHSLTRNRRILTINTVLLQRIGPFSPGASRAFNPGANFHPLRH